jgi:hypothetical protein
MKTTALAWGLALSVAAVPLAYAADETKVNEGKRQVESGAKKIGEGLQETAKGVGKTVSEGAKVAGDKLKEAGKAAEPQARTAWESLRDGTVAAAKSIRSFFARLFSG